MAKKISKAPLDLTVEGKLVFAFCWLCSPVRNYRCRCYVDFRYRQNKYPNTSNLFSFSGLLQTTVALSPSVHFCLTSSPYLGCSLVDVGCRIDCFLCTFLCGMVYCSQQERQSGSRLRASPWIKGP